MKKIIILFIGLTLGGGLFVNAQSPKFGHIDMQQLVTVMPEYAAAMEKMQKEGDELEDMLSTMQQEYQKMVQEYTENRATMSDLVRQAKEDDISAKAQRIETFRGQAEEQIQKKQQDLYQPIVDKADSLIAVVAKENNLLYVFDMSTRVVLYKSNQSLDLLPLVKKKMGIE